MLWVVSSDGTQDEVLMAYKASLTVVVTVFPCSLSSRHNGFLPVPQTHQVCPNLPAAPYGSLSLQHPSKKYFKYLYELRVENNFLNKIHKGLYRKH